VITARRLRRTMTPAERVLWKAVRNKRLAGLKFNRQHPLLVVIEGRETFVVADFYCHKLGLVVEVDGPIHDTQKANDKIREAAIERIGLRVIRFTNDQVYDELPLVLEAIKNEKTNCPLSID